MANNSNIASIRITMTALFFRLALWAQVALFWASYYIFKPFVKHMPRHWVIGVTETANMLKLIGSCFDSKSTVLLRMHPYYMNNHYDYNPRFKHALSGYILSSLYGPILLAYLVHKSDNFFYIGDEGFFNHIADGRATEFSFLKKLGKCIVILFCGSDIRSIDKTIAFAQSRDIETYVTYQRMLNPSYFDAQNEVRVKQKAKAADLYADVIFNAKQDQMSYLESDTLPFPYFHPDHLFVRTPEKFNDLSCPRIVHATSSPISKGTPLVRAAIKKLKLEGYTFAYTELFAVPHTQVLETLGQAHIVLNEFYAFMPGVFGIEAMANHCALVTSADPTIETDLPVGAADAWYVTGYWAIYDHLKDLLDHPEKIKIYADRGYDWTFKNYSTSHAKIRLLEQLNANA